MTININKILGQNQRSSLYGAPMGARDIDDREESELEDKVYCQRVWFTDGDYASDGTYWGGGKGSQRLYCAFNESGTLRLYTRAQDRKDAIVRFKFKHTLPLEFHMDNRREYYQGVIQNEE